MSIGGILGSLLGGLGPDSTIGQIFLYNIVGGVLSGAFSPLATEIIQEINSQFPDLAISPSDAASAVVRGFWGYDRGAQEASYGAIDSDRFRVLVDLAGNALAPEELAVALRRGIIPEDSGSAEGVGFVQGIAQGNLANKWAPVIKALSVADPSPADALDALLEGQIDQATAQDLYHKFGGNPQYFEMLFNTRGQAPTPNEALVLLNRGIITERGTGPASTSYEQAFLEGPWRNKWLEPFIALRTYYPPPRTVTAMYNDGSMSKAVATDYLRKQGLTDDLIAMYLPDKTTSTQSAAKLLAKSEIEAAYGDKLITPDAAGAALVELGYSEHDAALMLQIQDFRVVISQMRTVLGRVRSLYLSGKIQRDQAMNALNGLQMTPDQVSQTLDLWQLAKFEQVKDLTAGEVVAGHHYSVIDSGTAMSLLQGMGYSPWESWFLLSVRNHSALPDVAEPPRDQLNNPAAP